MAGVTIFTISVFKFRNVTMHGVLKATPRSGDPGFVEFCECAG